MKKVLLFYVITLTIVLTACGTGTETQVQKDEENPGNVEENVDQDAEKGVENNEKQNAEGNSSYEINVKHKKFQLRDAKMPIQFEVTKDGESYLGAVLQLKVNVEGTELPFTVEEVGDGSYEGAIRVETPGDYKVKVTERENGELLGTFKVTVSSSTS